VARLIVLEAAGPPGDDADDGRLADHPVAAVEEDVGRGLRLQVVVVLNVVAADLDVAHVAAGDLDAALFAVADAGLRDPATSHAGLRDQYDRHRAEEEARYDSPLLRGEVAG
jgi:hypothetical protein